MPITPPHGGDTMFSSKSYEVLVGTNEGVVFLTRNCGGSGWSVAHWLLTDKHIHVVIVEPRSGTIIARPINDPIYVSKDGEKTWEQLRGSLPVRLQASVEAMCLED